MVGIVLSERPEHQPVLVDHVLRIMDPRPGDVVLDGTVGLGGHAAAILPRILPGGRYVGLDLDDSVLAVARERLASLAPVGDVNSDSLVPVILGRANYADFADTLSRLGIEQVGHMLLDLGVNSAQLADARRGFSFEREGPLDMRFDRTQSSQALDLVNGLSENDLADLIYDYGQDPLSRKIAKRICQVRHEGRITTTRALAAAVESLFAGGRERYAGKTHPATRVFQALRIVVNAELENINRFLAGAPDHLRSGGTLAVISFHSLEDSIFKTFLKNGEQSGAFADLTRRPVVADPQERNQNPRSRSAKLRVARKN